MSLRSLATAPAGSRAAAAMGDVCDAVARKLDALLFAPLRLGDAPLVLVPTGALHALPWSMLPVARAPAARGRAVAAALAPGGDHTATPATRSRCSSPARGCRPRPRRSRRCAARHPEARTLTGEDATVRNVARALDGADSVHVAAHGRFRVDNPQFTSLELANGRVTVYDLERLQQGPEPDRALELRVRPLRGLAPATS